MKDEMEYTMKHIHPTTGGDTTVIINMVDVEIRQAILMTLRKLGHQKDRNPIIINGLGFNITTVED